MSASVTPIDPPAFLATLKNPVEVAMTQSLLRGCGIPTHTQTPLASQFTTVLFGGEILGADLYVPESMLDDARELLKAAPVIEEDDV
ncbi:hypothetical protein FACS18949_04160 [Clostridia bacterium]|nr:hypothetical protein FACS189425_10390 [Clostridia bacterium]GHV32633.1 hypothetical protein FACS18949_04160 [Clostridia bacterium]